MSLRRFTTLASIFFCLAAVSLHAQEKDPHPHDHAHEVAPPLPGDPLPRSENDEFTKFGVLTIYCILIVAGSILGGYLPSIIHLDHNRMQTMISFVGGLMLGIGVFHMLPHALHETGDIDFTMKWTMLGLLVMFFLLRTFHFHQHDVVVGHDLAQPAQLVDEISLKHAHAHAHGHDHGHAHQMSWMGIAIGLSLHTLLDGLALGAAVEADSHHEVMFSLFGVGIFLAILLHKPLDALSITSLMKASGWSSPARTLVNLGFSLMCPLGALGFVFGVGQISEGAHWIVGGALAAAGGIFICISLSDLLPEMEFHSHNRVQLSLALIAGVILAWGIGFLEPAHSHGGPTPPNSDRVEHSHHGHSH